jgi:hypothetical protein
LGGIQCKCKDVILSKSLTESDVKEEVERAKKFKPKLSEFIIATTAPKDAKIEEFARKIREDHAKEGLFSVHIMSWEDIKERLDDFPRVRDKYYPQRNSDLKEVKENDACFKRENAGKIIETVIKPLRDCARYIKPYFENGEYVRDLESKSMKLNLRFDGYEFIRICEGSNRFRIKDENLVLTYKRDEILNRSMQQIIELLGNYKENFITLKTAVENLNILNVPICFENYCKNYTPIEEKRKEEFLFKIYATVITGKEKFGGHVWATTLKEKKSKEILEIIKTDPSSNEMFNKIESLKKEIILAVDELIKELNDLDEEFQNRYCL